MASIIQQIAALEFALHINDTLCFLMGVPLNILLICIVALKSCDQLKPYRVVMISTAVLDLIFICVGFLV